MPDRRPVNAYWPLIVGGSRCIGHARKHDSDATKAGVLYRYRPHDGSGTDVGAAEVKGDRSAGLGDRGRRGGRIEAGVRRETADGDGVGTGLDSVEAIGAAARGGGGCAVAEIDGYTVDPHALDRNLARDGAGRRRRNNVLSASRDDREHQQRCRRKELLESVHVHSF